MMGQLSVETTFTTERGELCAKIPRKSPQNTAIFVQLEINPHMNAKRLTHPLLIIGSPGAAPDIRYATGFVTLDPVVYLRHKKKNYLVVPVLELGRAQNEAPQSIVLTPQDLQISPEERGQVSAWAVGLLRHLSINAIQAGPQIPAGAVRAIEQRGVRVELSNQPPFPERAIKKKEELIKLAEAQTAAVAAMRAAVCAIRDALIARDGRLMRRGKALTSERVRELVDLALLKHGCMARDTIIAGGRQGADPHDRGRGPLRAGQTIVLDIFPQHKTTGYWGDITRTVIKGTPTPTQEAMYRAVFAAQRDALAMAKPGMPVRRIHEHVTKTFADRGFKTEVKEGVARGFFHGTGHGVGLEIHEAPSISLNDAVLREGHVVTIEPGLYDPEHGGVRIEDTVIITRSGCRPLATFPKTFRLP